MNMKADKLTQFTDPRGTLVPVEFSMLPFVPVRMFYVKDVPQGTIRGQHGHFKCRQYYICMAGLIVVKIHRSAAMYDMVILKPGHGLYIPEMLWTSEEFCTEGTMLQVLCSEPYDKEDYFTDKNICNAR
jgi:dTDP-4-dehydrorhamnose 3,5-epimerase-like enzyme